MNSRKSKRGYGNIRKSVSEMWSGLEKQCPAEYPEQAQQAWNVLPCAASSSPSPFILCFQSRKHSEDDASQISWAWGSDTR